MVSPRDKFDASLFCFSLLDCCSIINVRVCVVVTSDRLPLDVPVYLRLQAYYESHNTFFSFFT